MCLYLRFFVAQNKSRLMRIPFAEKKDEWHVCVWALANTRCQEALSAVMSSVFVRLQLWLFAVHMYSWSCPRIVWWVVQSMFESWLCQIWITIAWSDRMLRARKLRSWWFSTVSVRCLIICFKGALSSVTRLVFLALPIGVSTFDPSQFAT